MATIRFYFDYVSHNAYLAWTQLPALAARYGATIERVPVLFAGLLDAHGTLGPAEIPAKTAWMNRNVLRKAAQLGVPLQPPAFHPFNPLLALRISSLPLEADARRRLIDGLFAAVWARSLHVEERAVVEAVVCDAGFDGAALIEAASQPENKARVRQQTDDAIADGVFGVPSMIVDGELFWGFDDLRFVELRLAGKDPLDPREAARWQRPVQASATRRRV
ncbi:MAG: 2-hydroxychromene-2-carboxylate isomerase [Deltaproteobacteria bacterium]|nr:2-hydroxychromene-2-carboxylate isomerase [Deltaproteobacteria bacterium]